MRRPAHLNRPGRRSEPANPVYGTKVSPLPKTSSTPRTDALEATHGAEMAVMDRLTKEARLD